MRTIVCITDPAEADLVISALPSQHPGVFCSTPEHVVAFMQQHAPPNGIVWELVPERSSALLAALRAVHLLNPSLPQLFRIALGAENVRVLLEAVRVSTKNVIVSLRGHDALARDLEALRLIGPCGRSEAAILARLADALDRRGSPFVAKVATAAVLLGRQPATVTTLARAMGMSTHLLRVSLRRELMLEPNALLRWTFVLHCLGQAERARRPLKAIAGDAGYKRAEALTNRMARLRGMRIREAIRAGGFSSFLEEFVQLFDSAHQPALDGLRPRRLPKGDDRLTSVHGTFA